MKIIVNHMTRKNLQHVHMYMYMYIYIFVYTQYQSLYIYRFRVNTVYKYGTTLQHTMFITPLIIIVPKLTAWHCHIVHSVLTDIVHPESLRMKRMCWACAFSAHAHVSICNRSIALDRHLRHTGISDDVRPS